MGGGFAFTQEWLPNDVGGLVDWHRSDLGITLVGSKVSTWVASSGNGHDLTQGTDANRPAYQLDVVAGKPSVRFTAASSHTMAYSAWAHPNPACTAFAVIKMQAAPAEIQ